MEIFQIFFVGLCFLSWSQTYGTVHAFRGTVQNRPLKDAHIYHTWVILPNHHPSQTARHSFSVFFQFRLANPTNIANANPDPSTPADRVVPIHGWRTKKDQKGGKRGGAMGSISSFPGFSSRAVLGWWFDSLTHVW